MDTSRRELLLGAAALAATRAVAQNTARTMIGVPFEPHERVRMGLIGAGGRGSSMLRRVPGVRERSDHGDLRHQRRPRAQGRGGGGDSGGTTNRAPYTKGERDYENLVKRDDIDFVYCPVPWQCHAPAAIAAMENGKHALVEVPVALTLEDCWKLVDTSERTRKHCIMCENCCYGYNELMVLNMVRAGMLGDLLPRGRRVPARFEDRAAR